MHIIFHHIPRTGGTELIQNLTLKHARTPYDMPIDYNGTVLSSHWAFRDYTGDGFYFTLLRDPVDMFYSGWHYFRRSLLKLPYIGLIRSIPTFDMYVDVCKCMDHYFPLPELDLDFDRFDAIGWTERRKTYSYRRDEITEMLSRHGYTESKMKALVR